MHIESPKTFCIAISDNANQPNQRSQCSIQHGRNHTANNIYKCWTSCNKCKYLFLQYFVTNQKHNSCKIYLKIIQVVSKGRNISWLAGGVIGYDSETKGATQGPFHQSLVPIGQISFREDFKWFYFVEFSIFSNGGHVGWERDHRIQFWKGTTQKHHQSCQA